MSYGTRGEDFSYIVHIQKYLLNYYYNGSKASPAKSELFTNFCITLRVTAIISTSLVFKAVFNGKIN